MKEKKKTPKPRTPSVLDSPNWISESTSDGFAASSQARAADGSGSGSPDPCNITFIKQCVATPWTNNEYDAWPNLESNCSASNVTWVVNDGEDGSTETQIDQYGVVSFGPKGAKVTITATCMGAEASMTLVYVKAELLEVEFANAHRKDNKENVITDEQENHVEDGAPFDPPFRGWKKTDDVNNAVAHTFTDSPKLNLKVEITPNDLSFDISGKGLAGPFGELVWNRAGLKSTGAPQGVLNVPCPSTLLQSPGITKGLISWIAKVTGCAGAGGIVETATTPEQSGEHEIFRVFARPNVGLGAVVEPSLRRMRTVCEWTEGAESDEDAVEKLIGAWPYLPVDDDYDPEGHDLRMLDGESADCDDHCNGVVFGLHLLGLPAATALIMASTDDNVCMDDLETKDVLVGVPVPVWLYFATIAGGVVGENISTKGGNHHQGVVRAAGMFWNVYGQFGKKDTSCQMFNWLTSNAGDGWGIYKAQYWVTKLVIPNPVDPTKPFESFLIHSAEDIPTLTCTDPQ